MRIRIFGHFLHLPSLALALAEFVAFGLAMLVGVVIQHSLSGASQLDRVVILIPRILMFAVLMSLSFLSLGLYTTRQRAGVLGVGVRMALATIAALAVTALVFYLVPDVEIERAAILVAAPLAVAGAAIIRMIAFRFFAAEGLKRRVLLYGDCESMGALARMRRRSDRAGFHLVGVVCRSDGGDGTVAGLNILKAPKGLKALCQDLQVDEVVVAMTDRRQQLSVRDLLQCRFAGIAVVELITFLERETGRIHLDQLTPSWLIFGDGFRRDGVRLFTVRAFDFFASGALLLLASPFMLMAAAAIWLEDGRKAGSIFYSQERVGFEGRVFPLTKFRSMRMDAEAGGAQWATIKDSRVTRVGAFMRKTRIDELPQLLNVLRGHMSFVGPRPERPHFVAALEKEIPYYSSRHSVKPGITGWAQLCYPYGSSVEDARQKLQYDLYYVKHHNLIFDVSILLQTVEVVLMGKGAR
jgi:sugar transferase (PEP-CTERM system associated)